MQSYTTHQARPIRDWIQAAVEERQRENPVRTEDQSSPTDLLQALIEAIDQETGTQFLTTGLVNQACAFFWAGHETSASSLSMAIDLLAQYPDCQQRLWQEVSTLLRLDSSHGGDSEAPLDYAELCQLPYCAAILMKCFAFILPSFF